MKVSIIGGGGLVGSMAAYALQAGGKVGSLCLIDANQDAARGHALELLHGACLTSDTRLSAGTMEDVATSDAVVITAGLRRKPDESRLDLINRNVDLFLTLLDQVKAAGLKDATGPRVFWVVGTSIWSGWWVSCIAVVVTRVTLFGRDKKKGDEAGPNRPPASAKQSPLEGGS